MTLPTRLFCLIAMTLFGSCQASHTAHGKRLTLAETHDRTVQRALLGNLERWRWAEDGVHLVRGRGEEQTWMDPTGSHAIERPSSLPAPRPRAEFPVDLLASPAGDRSYQMLGESTDGVRQLCLHAGGLYLIEWVDSSARFQRLDALSNASFELAELSPDGSHVAFVQGNNLMLIDCATGKPQALTSDGSFNVFNGKLDWVYQEEIYGRGDFKGFWWSPDSKHIAFLRLDESAVKPFTVVDHIEPGTFQVKAEVTKYPKSGDPNPSVALGIISVADQPNARWVELQAPEGSHPLVVRVGWTPEGRGLLYMLQDRIQTYLEFNQVDPLDLKTRRLIREESESWCNRCPAPRWLPDGSFLWLSERSGYRHIYHYEADGKLRRQLTDGPWPVGSITHVDARGQVWFSAAKDGAINQNIYRVSLHGGAVERITRAEGSHRLSFNGDRSAYLDHSSSLTSAPRVSLHHADGQLIQVLARTNKDPQRSCAAAPWELHRVPNRSGFELDVALLKPLDFNPDHAYPVWIHTYSGPNAPTVRNRWNTNAWFQFLAQNGVIVLQVNVRSASGRGLVHTSSCYRELGVHELEDLEDTVAWLTAKPFADKHRVGITGHSYGGFMSAYAMTHSKAFALGIGSSGVYDWGMYDSIYTERYMQTPALNPDGYRRTSVLTAAAELHGHLILTHGVMDDNVHFQNALQLAYALQKAEKDFEFMPYPQSRHGINQPGQPQMARRIAWRAIQEYLLKP